MINNYFNLQHLISFYTDELNNIRFKGRDSIFSEYDEIIENKIVYRTGRTKTDLLFNRIDELSNDSIIVYEGHFYPTKYDMEFYKQESSISYKIDIDKVNKLILKIKIVEVGTYEWDDDNELFGEEKMYSYIGNNKILSYSDILNKILFEILFSFFGLIDTNEVITKVQKKQLQNIENNNIGTIKHIASFFNNFYNDIDFLFHYIEDYSKCLEKIHFYKSLFFSYLKQKDVNKKKYIKSPEYYDKVLSNFKDILSLNIKNSFEYTFKIYEIIKMQTDRLEEKVKYFEDLKYKIISYKIAYESYSHWHEHVCFDNIDRKFLPYGIDKTLIK